MILLLQEYAKQYNLQINFYPAYRLLEDEIIDGVQTDNKGAETRVY